MITQPSSSLSQSHPDSSPHASPSAPVVAVSSFGNTKKADLRNDVNINNRVENSPIAGPSSPKHQTRARALSWPRRAEVSNGSAGTGAKGMVQRNDGPQQDAARTPPPLRPIPKLVTTRGRKRGANELSPPLPIRHQHHTRSQSHSYVFANSTDQRQEAESGPSSSNTGDINMSRPASPFGRSPKSSGKGAASQSEEDMNMATTPSSPIGRASPFTDPFDTPPSDIKRRIAPLRSSSRSLRLHNSNINNSTLSSMPKTSQATSQTHINAYTYRDKNPSRDSSPPTTSSPLKRPRTSISAPGISNDIINFHYSSDSDSDSETPSPTLRTRTRFNQLLGPSPLQKSFSSSTSSSPPTPCGPLQKSQSFSTFNAPSRPPLTPVTPEGAFALYGKGGRSGLGYKTERSVSTPTTATMARLTPTNSANGVEVLSPLSTRAKMMSEVEGLGTELNKVFALVHGRSLGVGNGGRGRRVGSGLRPADGDEKGDVKLLQGKKGQEDLPQEMDMCD